MKKILILALLCMALSGPTHTTLVGNGETIAVWTMKDGSSLHVAIDPTVPENTIIVREIFPNGGMIVYDERLPLEGMPDKIIVNRNGHIVQVFPDWKNELGYSTAYRLNFELANDYGPMTDENQVIWLPIVEGQ